MIFTDCTNPECGDLIILYYESGQEPVGAFERVECETCHANSYVERISFGGRTYSEEEFFKLNPKKIEKETDAADT